jgi:GTP-binding protein
MTVRFIKSAKEPKDFPTLCSLTGAPLREVAVVGRSNVGKSTLLNTLFGVKGMSKTSSQPGKTRLLNFFSVDERLFFVDFPGWGYAKVGKEDRHSFLGMVKGYFETNRDLALLLFLFDIRRDPTEEDLQVWQWFKEKEIPVALVLTKVDKFGVTHRAKEIKRVRQAFGVSEKDVFPCSSLEGLGKKELWGRIDSAVSR